MLSYDSHPIRKREEYDSISTSSRRALIKLIFDHNVSIRIATNYLGLKYSTGKTLVQQFRRTGTIDRVKKQRASNARKTIKFGPVKAGKVNHSSKNSCKLPLDISSDEDEDSKTDDKSIALDMDVVVRLQRNEDLVHD